ncbi:hypothetical protein H4219_003273 [Mycoemilia scoparia]|uniref:L-type lectin-like domain-containing protein n=1 Tax=Mycoemilia scoparia TaxID=417184 RepID=A0A9W8DPH2_9FUNG|nr:hypothetical protein H4219_003273 [Mycoemilia scoparia]
MAQRLHPDILHLRQFTLEPPFVDDAYNIRNWDFSGDAIIDTNSHIRLTGDLPSQKGHIWSRQFLPSEGWQIDFEINIGGKGGYLYGDGMAMWATRGRLSQGPIYGNMDYFDGLGIVFDTYANSQHDFTFPVIMGVLGDGKTSYDYAHDGDANRKGKCEVYYRNQPDPMKVKVSYIKGSFVNVHIKLHEKDWMDCFTITNVTLPNISYLGYSALTGEISDIHNLYSVKVSTMRPGKMQEMRMPTSFNQLPAPESATSSGFFSILFKLVLVAGVFAGIYFAYNAYTKSNTNRF